VAAFGSAPQTEERTYRKVTMRIVPFLFICYLAAYLDRVNVGFAKLQMLHELNFSETVYGFGAGISFLGYVLFEVPSNCDHAQSRRPAVDRPDHDHLGVDFRRYGFVYSACAFCSGVAEAGFIPGILLYLTYWYPAKRRGRVTAIFLTAIPMASIFGSPLSGWILNAVSGAHGFSGWQWLFLLETIPSLVLGIVTLLYLDDRVASVMEGDGQSISSSANVAQYAVLRWP
jgi:sugar phosphate permease